jgi:hypothetical protein
MKFACLVALLFSNLSLAAEPRFDIPDGAYRSRGRCTIERSTREAKGNGWTDWHNRKDSELFHFTYWNTADSVHSVEDRGHTLKYTQMKNLAENDFEIKRLEKVEDWVYQGKKWSVTSYLLDITIVRRKGGPNLRIERWEDGRVFQWEASAAPDGTITKNLLNPEVLNTKERQIGLLRTVCRH